MAVLCHADRMKSIRPPALKTGDTIGVMAPSSRVEKAIVKKAVALLKEAGYEVYVHPQTWTKDRQSAGTPEAKARALHDLYRRKDIRAIFCARGGNRAMTMLEHLDFSLIGRNPKILLGFSDVTALLNAIHKETGQITFHGPVLHTLGQEKLPRSHLKQCFGLLAGENRDIPLNRATVLQPGKASGKLVGGNLSLLCSLAGTPWQPDTKGAILFIEDCHEEISRIDRMLQHLRHTGMLSEAAAVIFGEFKGLGDTSKVPFGRSLKDVIGEAVAGYKTPVVMNAPFGHGNDLYTFPVGAKARLTAANGKAVLKLDEPAVS